jgi:hypothetical protein
MGFLDAIFGQKPGTSLPGYKRDHEIPERRLVHGFLALYTGNGGDPFHTMDRQANVDHLQKGWDLSGPAKLRELMDGYEEGECTPAFDLARVIKLARHGAGALWVTEDESWQRCIRCAQRLKQRYPTWQAVYDDFQAGRVQWYREVAETPLPEKDVQFYAKCYSVGQDLIYSKMPLNP